MLRLEGFRECPPCSALMSSQALPEQFGEPPTGLLSLFHTHFNKSPIFLVRSLQLLPNQPACWLTLLPGCFGSAIPCNIKRQLTHGFSPLWLTRHTMVHRAHCYKVGQSAPCGTTHLLANRCFPGSLHSPLVGFFAFSRSGNQPYRYRVMLFLWMEPFHARLYHVSPAHSAVQLDAGGSGTATRTVGTTRPCSSLTQFPNSL